MLWQLFYTFLKIGFISFGGGYAMIPVIEHEALSHHWMNSLEYTNAVAVSGMSPGPIATNSAIFVGYQTAGIVGAIVSAVGMVIPSLLIIIVIALFFVKINEHKLVKAAFYGLRAVVTGLIIYAAVHLAEVNGVIGSISWRAGLSLLLFAAAFLALVKYRVHPLLVILGSGLVGVTFYG